jgi:hypothetical protein
MTTRTTAAKTTKAKGRERARGKARDDDRCDVKAVQIASCVTQPTGRLSLEQARPFRSPVGPGGFMRSASILSLALTAAGLAGCAPDSPRTSNQETAVGTAQRDKLPARDLTLRTPATPAIEVASPVELSRALPQPRSTRRPRISPKPAPAPAPDPVPEASPAAEAAVPAPTMEMVRAEPAPEEDATAGAGRELAPGKTVTVIPASSGPSYSPEEPSWGPPGPGRSVIIGGGGGRGGKCRPRGGVRGIGIAGRIPIGVPGGRLR